MTIEDQIKLAMLKVNATVNNRCKALDYQFNKKIKLLEFRVTLNFLTPKEQFLYCGGLIVEQFIKQNTRIEILKRRIYDISI